MTLLAYKRGEPRVCSMVRPPTPEAEDERRICRERADLVEERVRHVNRIKGLLFSQGVRDYEPLRRDRRQRLAALRGGDGRPLGPRLRAQIGRELDRLELLLEQIAAVEGARDALLAAARRPPRPSSPEARASRAAPRRQPSPVALLMSLKGIGPEFAAVLWTEGLCRSFANRRQAAAYAGLTPTPWRSGTIDHEQGLSKAGNPRLRTKMLQLAWLWLAHQPQSALARWFHQRLPGMTGKAARKRLIVALARKLFVALWKFTSAGVLVEGAVMKTRRLTSRPEPTITLFSSAEARSASADPGRRPMDCMAVPKRRCEEWSRLPSPRRRKQSRDRSGPHFIPWIATSLRSSR